jgi:Spy/CpxP family protein refolding chaperone
MTSLAESGQHADSGPRWLHVILVASLVLNLWFVGVLAWHVAFPPQPPLAEIANELGLNGAQRQAARQFGSMMHERTREMRKANEPLLREIWTEAARANPDQTRIDALIGQVTANRRDTQEAQVKALVTFMTSLTPEQRARFAELIQHRRNADAHRRSPWRMLLP